MGTVIALLVIGGIAGAAVTLATMALLMAAKDYFADNEQMSIEDI